MNDLPRELLKFLALECPLLLPAARRIIQRHRTSPAKFENDLLVEIERAALPSRAECEAQIYPGATAGDAAGWNRAHLHEAVGGFFRRCEIRASITDREKLQMYRWMVLTRTLDNRLKELFDARDVGWNQFASPMKGFRSLGQEAIAGFALRLRRGEDVIAPAIRDLGAIQM